MFILVVVQPGLQTQMLAQGRITDHIPERFYPVGETPELGIRGIVLRRQTPLAFDVLHPDGILVPGSGHPPRLQAEGLMLTVGIGAPLSLLVALVRIIVMRQQPCVGVGKTAMHSKIERAMPRSQIDIAVPTRPFPQGQIKINLHRFLRPARNDIDHPAHGIKAVQDRADPLAHRDPRHIADGQLIGIDIAVIRDIYRNTIVEYRHIALTEPTQGEHQLVSAARRQGDARNRRQGLCHALRREVIEVVRVERIHRRHLRNRIRALADHNLAQLKHAGIIGTQNLAVHNHQADTRHHTARYPPPLPYHRTHAHHPSLACQSRETRNDISIS